MRPRSGCGCWSASSGTTPAPEIGLVRHPPVSIAAGTCYGRTDVPLRPGWERWVGEVLPVLRQPGFARIHSSPATRCRRPAAAIAAELAIPLLIDDRLAELDFGEWEGRPWAEIPRNAVDEWAAAPLDFAPPGGEPVRAMIGRVSRCLPELRRGPPTLLLSHGGPLRVLVRLLAGLPVDASHPAPAMGSVRIVAMAGDPAPPDAT
ncbi:MAG: histidine phosphatase family protein [Gluconacetobacter diazotrophicus]|nr:histidine phosphatase family protein [Gluconacetobacter diazotrophicus]